MKKALLLAGAAVLFAGSAQAAEGLELGLAGSASVYGVFVEQDIDAAEVGIKKEMEVDFTGEMTLDSGLTVGAVVEMNVNDEDTTDDIEESYIYAEGGFGKVIVGQEYNAAYLMQVAAPAVDGELDGMDPAYNIVSNGSNIVENQSYAMYGDGDANSSGGDKVTYISPNYEGLQVGVTYTPDTDTQGSRGTMIAENDEAWSAAARYAVDDVVGADWVFGAGYNKDVDSDDDEWNIAAMAEKDAWTAGVSYYSADADSTGEETEAIAAGLNYENGKTVYGASYLYKEIEEDSLNRYMVGARYAYGPGMSLNGSVSYNSYESDAGNDEEDATVVAIGTVINF